MALRYVTALVGAALVSVCLAGAPTRVEAKPYPVRIESQPSGATVYLDSKEGEPLGQTPYTGKLKAGPHTLIIELDGYVSQVQDITIRRGRRVQRIAIKLSRIELASVEVVADKERRGAAADARGARILVDGKEMGRLPATVKVPAGPHQVEVVKEGYKTYETWIEAAEGEKLVVAADLAPLAGNRRVAAAGKGAAGAGAAAGAAAGLDEDEEDPDEGAEEERLRAAEAEALRDSGDNPDALVDRDEQAAPAGRQVPYFSVGAGFELGGRRYRADASSGQGLREYDAGAVPMFRVAGDINPLAFHSSKWISGWGLFASFAFATPLDSSATLQNGDEVDVPTKWNELDVGARFRYRFDPGTWIGVEGGYGVHTFGFDFSDQTDELSAEVPDVKYKFLRVGLEGRYSFGRVAALASGGTRMVSSIGLLGEGFATTDVVALHGGLGMAATLTDSIELQLVGHYDRYSHEYTAMAGGPLSSTSSGLDQFFGVTLGAFFLY